MSKSRKLHKDPYKLEQALKEEWQSYGDIKSFNNLLTHYSNSQKYKELIELYEENVSEYFGDSATWNIRLKVYVKQGQYTEAINFYEYLYKNKKKNLHIDSTRLNLFHEMGECIQGLAFFEHLKAVGMDEWPSENVKKARIAVYNTVLKIYSMMEMPDQAETVYQELKNKKIADDFSHNIMINMRLHQDKFDEALAIHNGLPRTERTLVIKNSTLKVYGRLIKKLYEESNRFAAIKIPFENAKKLFSEIKEIELDDIITDNTWLNVLINAKKINKARAYYKRLKPSKQKNFATLRVMLRVYDDLADVIKLINQIMEEINQSDKDLQWRMYRSVVEAIIKNISSFSKDYVENTCIPIVDLFIENTLSGSKRYYYPHKLQQTVACVNQLIDCGVLSFDDYKDRIGRLRAARKEWYRNNTYYDSVCKEEIKNLPNDLQEILDEVPGVFVVGGQVRSLLRREICVNEIDLVAPKTTKNLLQRYFGELKKSEHFSKDGVELYFASTREGKSVEIYLSPYLSDLEEDAHTRDFKANALYLGKQDGKYFLISPFGRICIQQAREGYFEFIDQAELSKDPWRLLRYACYTSMQGNSGELGNTEVREYAAGYFKNYNNQEEKQAKLNKYLGRGQNVWERFDKTGILDALFPQKEDDIKTIVNSFSLDMTDLLLSQNGFFKPTFTANQTEPEPSPPALSFSPLSPAGLG